MSTNGFVHLVNLAAPDVALQLTTFAAAAPANFPRPLLVTVGPAGTN